MYTEAFMEYLQKDKGQMSFNDLEGIEDEL